MNCPICRASLLPLNILTSTQEIVCWYCHTSLLFKITVAPKAVCHCPAPCPMHDTKVPSTDAED